VLITSSAGESEMRLRPLALLPLALAGGCAGYAIDYTRPKTSLIAPQLPSYGLSATQSECVAESLGSSLSVWQLRQLADVTGAAAGQRSVRELVWAAAQVKNPKVQAELARAIEICNVAAATASNATSTPEPAAASPAAGQGPARRPTWINLGSAPTGQAIAVDAATLAEQAPYREGWFRLSNPGEAGPSARAYLLRVDCSSRTINSMASRRFTPGGDVAEDRDYRPGGEGEAKVEGGTVMEIAYLALCT
jgi:hypothetical protein